MISLRRLALTTSVACLALAAPAQATLLVRSDGSGLLVQDKNGLDDFITVDPTTFNGEAAYEIRNHNNLDFFKFDMQTGCVAGSASDRAKCRRFNPQMNFALSSGDDHLGLAHPNPCCSIPPVPAGTASATAGSGNDELFGHIGRDLWHGGDGADQLSGGDGNDTLEGEAGNDVVTGGRGTDTLRGDAGSDTVDAKEPSGSGVADAISCGGGSDFLKADLVDAVPSSCENFEKSPVGETPHVKLPERLRVSRAGGVRVRLRCPRGVGGLGCKGRLQLRLDTRSGKSSRARRMRYRIKAGKRKTVKLRLSAKDVRTLRSRKRRGKTTRGILKSVEKGRKGPKTTTGNPRLKVR